MAEGTINVLMCGSDIGTVKGGMVTVVKNYLAHAVGLKSTQISYIPTHTEGNAVYKSIYFAWAYLRILWRLITGRADLVHLHTAERGSFFRKALLVQLCKRLHVPVLMHHHSAEFEEFYRSLSEGRKRYVQRILTLTDMNLVLSSRLAGMLKEKAPDAAVTVLYNAVAVPEINPYTGKERNLLFLGRLGERKGIYDFLEVMKELDAVLPADIKLYLCGDGDVEKVRERTKKCGLSGRTAHIGWVEMQEKKAYLNHTMVNVLPSYYEGLPMSILEAMAEGIPCISTDIASIPEVINPGVNGELITPGDRNALKKCILALAEDEGLRLKYSNAAFAAVSERFSLDAHLEKLEDIYRRMGGKKR